jgi:diguanylate cyclase (GGDEF)-like protein
MTLVGVLALTGMATLTFTDLQHDQSELERLLAIKQRVDELSVTSDNLIASGADEARLNAYRRQARSIQRDLRELGNGDRLNQRAIQQLDNLVAAITRIDPTTRHEGAPQGIMPAPIGPLGLSPSAHATIRRVGDQEAAIDTTLSQLLDQERDRISHHVDWLIGSFIGITLVFAAFCASAVGIVYRRLNGPIRALESTIDRILAGDKSARAPVTGKDELAKLAATFNAMLTQQEQTQSELNQQKEALEERDAMLTESQRIAQIGSWRYVPDTGELIWSDQTFRILGFDPERDEPNVEAFYRRVCEADRDRIRACDRATLDGQPQAPIEFRVIDDDGAIRQIRKAGERRRKANDSGWFLAGTIQDITEQKALEAERYHLSEQLSAILESVTDAMISLDGNWRFAYINNEAADLLALPPSGGKDRNLWQAVPAFNSETIETALRRAMEQRTTQAVEEHLKPFDRWLDIRAFPSPQGLTLLIRDTTEHHRMLHRLMDQESRLTRSHEELRRTLESRQALINSLPANVALLDTQGNILDINEQWRHFGMEGGQEDPEYGLGRNYIDLCETACGGESEGAAEVAQGLRGLLAGERDTFTYEYPCHAPDRQQWFRLVGNRVGEASSDPQMGAVVMHVDITERKRAEQALNRLAYEDALTGLASRHGFTEAVTRQLTETGWQPHARLVMLDLNQQHDVNETYGFEAGDQLLITIGQRLAANASESAIIGRSGGDEFVAFLPAATEAEGAAACEALASSFTERFPVDGHSLDRRASFGFTRLGETTRSSERLLREAEMALFYAGAERGPEEWSAYDPELEARSQQRVEVTEELRLALARDEFELHFQPKAALANGELIGAEALLRWWHPERGLQSPGLFVPIAEQSQLIGPIGDWVLNDACRRLRAWQDEGLDLVRISVNVSVVQFANGDFPETVRRALASNGIAASALTLEITESVFEQNASSLHRQLHELHEMGVRLSLDDFGTGYSSLLYLQQYPFDEIKIDKGFVMSLQSEPYNAQVVGSVIGIAEALGAEVIAEGVESQSIADALLSMDCRMGQGFYYGMPLAPEDFQWLLATRSRLPLGRDGKPSDDQAASR